jgi:hypothetical protein
MKTYFKYILLTAIFGLAACADDITDINFSPKTADNVPGQTLFSNAEKNLSDIMTTPSVNSNVFRLLSQQWAETTYTDESRYNLSTRNIPQNFWDPFYRDILRDLQESQRITISDKGITDENIRKNRLAIIDVLQVYAYSVLVNTYGDVPYTKALDYTNLHPSYDNAAAIYDDLISRLDADLAAFTTTSTSFGSADLIYAGSVPKWKKFAASLKLRLGMTLADVNPSKAKTVVESAVTSGLLASNADNAYFKYLSTTPNTNPVWVNLVQSGRQDFVAANTLVNIMKGLNDPRIPLYFTTDITGTGYSGGIYGTSNNYGKFSKPSTKVTDPTALGDLLDYSEVEFYLAEAVERGMNVGGTAETHYNNAITASITYWGGTAADAATYLANPAVAYTTAAGTFKQKIGTQKWISLFNRGFEAWVEYRRFDAPTFNTVPKPLGDFPSRFTYPVGEQNLNTASFNAAASNAGGDVVTGKVFWDKF